MPTITFQRGITVCEGRDLGGFESRPHPVFLNYEFEPPSAQRACTLISHASLARRSAMRMPQVYACCGARDEIRKRFNVMDTGVTARSAH
jgi:hypothetical protein